MLHKYEIVQQQAGGKKKTFFPAGIIRRSPLKFQRASSIF